MLIDDDPVFRLGLRVWLEQFPDVSIVAEAENGLDALQILATRILAGGATSVEAALADTIDLVILDISLGRDNPDRIQGLSLCQQLKSQYPNLSVLLLSTLPEPIILAAARRAGANGYCPKGIEAQELLRAMRQVAVGQAYWVQPAPDSGTVVAAPVAPSRPFSARVGDRSLRPPSLLSTLRRNLRRSGVQQIDAALADVIAQLQDLNLSTIDRAIVAGRYRELRAARWLVNRLLETPDLQADRPGFVESGEQQREGRSPSRSIPNSTSEVRQTQPSGTQQRGSSLVTQPASDLTIEGTVEGIVIDVRSLQDVLFDAVLVKLQTSLENETETALETDILRESKKRELFYNILRKIEDILSELRYSQIQRDQLPQKVPSILHDLWEAVTIDFFGKYYTVRLGDTDVEVVEVLLQDADTVQYAILDKIPDVIALLNHLLFQTPLVVDSTPYPPGNPESLARAELLLENWIIQTANGVMQPLLNHFANVEAIKENLYDRRLLSVRDIERFRNDLSWKYRWARYFKEPKDIFESQYKLLTFSGQGIKVTSIYAPRHDELDQLSGVQQAITLALETRDAVAPRLRSVISLFGNGVIYVLTEVIGRGIGLIGRGILKGIGNVWQDARYSRDRNQR
jgi:CheY-like chemotaxis protein